MKIGYKQNEEGRINVLDEREGSPALGTGSSFNTWLIFSSLQMLSFPSDIKCRQLAYIFSNI